MKLNAAILAHAVEVGATATPDRLVLTFDYPDHVEPLTYADLLRGGQILALLLADAGVRPGERFGIMMRNHPEFVYALVAASLARTVAVPLDPRTPSAQLRYMITHSDARAVVCTNDLVPALSEALTGAASVPLLTSRVACGAKLASSVVEIDSVLFDTPPRPVTQQVSDPHAPWQIMYTSGATGDPKGVVCENSRFGFHAMLGRALFNYGDDEVLYTGLSLAAGNAQAVTFASAVARGLPAVISERFTTSRLWDICRRHGCTTVSLVGGMATALYAEPPRTDDAANPVRVVVSTGMPRALWEDFERRFAVRILEWYGAVDGGVAFKPIGVGPIGSFGKPLPGMEMQIVDEQDRECPPGVVGELLWRNASLPTVGEYLDDPHVSGAKALGGWIRSADLCHRDADGWLFFDRRKGGGLRHNGDVVLPDSIERAAIEIPTVREACCYGVPARSGTLGENDIVLAVVLAPGASADPDVIFRHLARQLKPNFVPDYLHVVPEIPKTLPEAPQARLLAETFDPEAPNVCGRVPSLAATGDFHGA